MFDEKVDKYGNIYLIFDLEENISKDDIINMVTIKKIEDKNNRREIIDIFITYINKSYHNAFTDYSLLKNRKNCTKIKYGDIIKDENNIYKFPIIYIIYDENNIVQNDDDFIIPEYEKEIMKTGEIG